MFKQLRQRLLLMNLLMISIVIGIAFSTIYFMIYRDINGSIKQELRQESSFDISNREGLLPWGNELPREAKDPLPRLEGRGGERVVTFSLSVDKEGQILNTNSMVERSENYYVEILDLVQKSGEREGQLEVDNTHWSYLVTQKSDFIRYSFVDITAEKAVLERLVLIFIAVSLITFIMIVIISNISTNRSLRPIRKAFDQQKQFISDASHELKTPLAVIGTNVEVLLGGERNEGDRKWLNYIQSEVERMGKLTNDLLYLTQVENDEAIGESQIEEVINDKVESMMLGLDAVCFEKKITLNYEIEADVSFKGNTEQFIQMLLILMDNAIKYTPKGGNINMKLQKSTHNIRLIVRNTGSGIKEEDMPYLFDRFYRADKARSRKNGSYGLGLSIARAIVDKHKGKITCESVPFLETTFRVILPL